MEEWIAQIGTSLSRLTVNYTEAGDHDAMNKIISSVRDMKNIMNEMVQVIAQQQEQIRELQRMNSESEVYGRD